MTLLLLLVIYIAYIGLGIPDSLFGTAWPAIYTEFAIPISYSGYVASLIFGRDVSQSYIGLSMSASYVSILLSPVLFRLLAQNLSTGLFPLYLLVLFLIALAFTERLRRETLIPAKQQAR